MYNFTQLEEVNYKWSKKLTDIYLACKIIMTYAKIMRLLIEKTHQTHINLFISFWTNHDVRPVGTWIHDPWLTRS